MHSKLPVKLVLSLRILMLQIMNAMIVSSNITGSASMKTGILPCVSETKVDDNRIRQIPDDRIVTPVFRICFIRAMM